MSVTPPWIAKNIPSSSLFFPPPRRFSPTIVRPLRRICWWDNGYQILISGPWNERASAITRLIPISQTQPQTKTPTSQRQKKKKHPAHAARTHLRLNQFSFANLFIKENAAWKPRPFQISIDTKPGLTARYLLKILFRKRPAT